jgi:hypothetical protein
VLWLLYAWHRFGTVLPTAFFVKQPSAAAETLALNLRYMLEQLALGGLVLLSAFVIYRLLRSRDPMRVLAAEMRSRWGLFLALVAVLVYGATMATTHMMFAFRHFVPYLPATAILLVLVWRRADGDQGRSRISQTTPGLAIVVGVVLGVHVAQAYALYRISLQGLGTIGEYESQGAAGYVDAFVPAMRRNAEDTRRHWEQLNVGRHPRIWTFAAGVLPYAYQDAYIYEGLVSYRHNCSRDWKVFADYVHIFTRHGSLSRQLIHLEPEDIEIISRQKLHFNGNDEELLVYYNRAALPNRLPPSINQPCLPEPR